MSLPALAPRHQSATLVAGLVAALRAAGWRDATPTDRYTVAAGIRWLSPLMPPRTGHPPARLTITAGVVSLQTFTRKGAPLDQVTWGWVDPGNFAQVHDYVTQALAAARAERGES